jgi:hypothetical protein
MSLFEDNLDEIEGLSQRGQTLSIVDLINAKTIDVDMSAFCLYAVSNGASFLTSARPGNAGKTTLMACLLTFLPSDARIVSTGNPSVISLIQDSTRDQKLCVLSHEIGSGHWFGYIWGKYVGQFFNLMNKGHQIASCIHADTLAEMHDILVSKELEVNEKDFARLELILFMKLIRESYGYKRRVSAIYERDYETGRHHLLYSWDENSDTFIKHNDSTLLREMAKVKSIQQVSDEIQENKSFIESLVKSGITDFRDVRKMVLGRK